jgi:regulator of sigma E protease
MLASAAVSVVYFLLMVGLLVCVHELGHFAAAKALGVKVLRFSLGFGPALARLSGRETEYRIGCVPLGGYVRLLGEDPADPVADEDRDRAFSEKPLWARLIVVFAGPAANLIAPAVIYFAFFAGHRELPAAVIGDLLPGGPAAAAGLEPGDRVLEINDAQVRYWEELEQIVDRHAGAMLRFKLRRGAEEHFAYVAPRAHTIRGRDGEVAEQGLIGVVQAPFPAAIGVLDPASPAARAGLRTGDRVVSVDGRPVTSYTALERELGRSWKRASLAVLRPTRAAVGFADVTLSSARLADLVAERPSRTGIHSAELVVAAVEPGTPAAQAGLAAGDLITTLDGAPVAHWMLLEQALLAEPDHMFRIGWLHGVEPREAEVRQAHRSVVDEYGQRHDRLVFGAQNDFRLGVGEMVPIDGRFGYAAEHAIERTWATTALMARGLVSLIRGQLPRDTVGGPIMMFRMASVSGAKGWDAFLMMLALISINLGLINLLPIPILDGGHLVMFAIEAVRRRRVSARVRDGVVLAGLVLIVSLTLLALRNDIVRYLIH